MKMNMNELADFDIRLEANCKNQNVCFRHFYHVHIHIQCCVFPIEMIENLHLKTNRIGQIELNNLKLIYRLDWMLSKSQSSHIIVKLKYITYLFCSHLLKKKQQKIHLFPILNKTLKFWVEFFVKLKLLIYVRKSRRINTNLNMNSNLFFIATKSIYIKILNMVRKENRINANLTLFLFIELVF